MELELRRQAVDRAYRDCASDVYRVAFAIIRDPEAAMDVTQETFARAFERWDQYDTNRPLRAWLHGIGAHAALDALRRRRLRTMRHGGTITELTMAGDTGADPAVQVSRRQWLEDCLDELKPPARAAVILRHYYGYDYGQIAEFLGTSAGNVGSMLSRANALLRSRLVATDEIPPAPSRFGGPVADDEVM